MTTDPLGSAVISDCGRYRYKLSRRTTKLQLSEDGKRAVWIMLNPSTADAVKNDPTINAVMDFSTRWLCTHVDVVNLYALRATDPRELWKVDDPVGPDNNHWIADACSTADMVICAWGSNAQWGRVNKVMSLLPSQPYALAINKDGHPKHPLYIARATRPEFYDYQEVV